MQGIKRLRHLCTLMVFALGLFLTAMPSMGVAQAQPSKGKPALYEFGAKTCIPCQQMKQVMAELTASHSDQVEFRMVYVDENRPLFGEYKIVAIPTQVFLDASGKEVDRHLGALTKEEVLRKLKELKFIK
jgi:thioredoxin 1